MVGNTLDLPAFIQSLKDEGVALAIPRDHKIRPIATIQDAVNELNALTQLDQRGEPGYERAIVSPEIKFRLRSQRKHVHRSPGLRPDLGRIHGWASLWGAELRRNRDKSYDAMAQFNGILAWEEMAKAAREVPGPALVAIRATLKILRALALSVHGSTPLDKIDRPGAEGDARFKVVSTRYVRLEHAQALIEKARKMGEEGGYAGTIVDEERCGLAVYWGPT